MDMDYGLALAYGLDTIWISLGLVYILSSITRSPAHSSPVAWLHWNTEEQKQATKS